MWALPTLYAEQFQKGDSQKDGKQSRRDQRNGHDSADEPFLFMTSCVFGNDEKDRAEQHLEKGDEKISELAAEMSDAALKIEAQGNGFGQNRKKNDRCDHGNKHEHKGGDIAFFHKTEPFCMFFSPLYHKNRKTSIRFEKIYE